MKGRKEKQSPKLRCIKNSFRFCESPWECYFGHKILPCKMIFLGHLFLYFLFRMGITIGCMNFQRDSREEGTLIAYKRHVTLSATSIRFASPLLTWVPLKIHATIGYTHHIETTLKGRRNTLIWRRRWRDDQELSAINRPMRRLLESYLIVPGEGELQCKWCCVM